MCPLTLTNSHSCHGRCGMTTIRNMSSQSLSHTEGLDIRPHQQSRYWEARWDQLVLSRYRPQVHRVRPVDRLDTTTRCSPTRSRQRYMTRRMVDLVRPSP